MASSGSRILLGLASAAIAGADAAGAAAEALPLDLGTLTNQELANLPSAELVVHLHGDDGSDFADAALLLAARDRRLAEAEDRARAADAAVAALRDTVRALELRVANAEAEAEAEAEDLAREPRRRRIGLVPDLNLTPSEIEEEEEQLAGGDDDEICRARDLITPSEVVTAPEPEQLITGDDEIRAPDQLVTANNEMMIVVVREPEPELPAAGERETTAGVCSDAGGVTVADIPAEDDDVPCPTPLMTIVAEAPFPVAAAADEVLGHIVLGKRKEPAADHSLTSDELRVTGHKHVSEKEAHGEDMGASHHRRSQGEEPERATKKARKHKGIYFHFHTQVLKALKEKEELVKKKEKEALAKEAAAAASKQLHWQHCGCWSNAPSLP